MFFDFKLWLISVCICIALSKVNACFACVLLEGDYASLSNDTMTGRLKAKPEPIKTDSIVLPTSLKWVIFYTPEEL